MVRRGLVLAVDLPTLDFLAVGLLAVGLLAVGLLTMGLLTVAWILRACLPTGLSLGFSCAFVVA